LPESDLPTVVTIHDLAFVRHPEWFTARGVSYFRRFLDRVVSGSSTVVVPSVQTAADCVQAGIASDRIEVVPWGIQIPQISIGDVESARTRLGLPDRFVLYVGTLEPRKNLDGLGRALNVLDDVPLVVVGPDGWGDTEIGGVRLPALSRADLDAVMAAATLLAYPSHFEGFGLPVLEAMAVGTAVVTTAQTAPAGILVDGGISVDTRSPRELAEAIEAIFFDEDLAAQYGEAGRLRAQAYPWARAAGSMRQVYEAAQQ